MKNSRFRVPTTIALGVVLAGLGLASASPAAASPGTGGHGDRPTVVLVHGGFADASGWDGVIDRLQRDGYPTLAVANPLRGLKSDSDYVRSVIATVPGPVVLVGHSYGGAVIGNAAAGAPNVKALVYVAGFAPDKGEAIGQFADPAKYPGALLTPDVLVIRKVPGGPEGSIDPARFREIFAADLSRQQTARMAVEQRPVALSVFEDPSPEAAWHSIPTWYAVSSQDKAISPVAERFFAKRMGATTIEIDASHVGFISHPDPIAALVEAAARATR